MTTRRPRPTFHGAPLGILLLDRGTDTFNRIWVPGSVGNAGTWSVPVRYKSMAGIPFKRIDGPDADATTSVVVQYATELVREGARMITSNCGFMIRYQDAVRAAVDVPVMLSSLLLVPILERLLPRGQALGIVTAKASSLTPSLMEAAGFSAKSERIVVEGMEHCPVFARSFVTVDGDFDYESVQKETVDTAVALVKRRPDIGALLLECSELPPYAQAVQRATGVPVYDFTSLVEFGIGGLARKPFQGFE